MHPKPSLLPRLGTVEAPPRSKILLHVRPWLLAAAFVGLAWGVGCAPALQLGPEVGPEEIPDLEERMLETPTAVPVLVRLGRAYRSADRLDDAVAILEQAAELDGTNPGVVVHLGLAYEAAERPEDARRVYEGYRQVGDSPELLSWIQGRTAVVRRQQLVLAARDAVRREEELAATPPQPRHVAVLPFQYTGADPQYAPLGRALAELLITDLSQTDRLTVLERMRVQVLLDEIGLVEEGLVDPATAARSGRLLGAERSVLGQLDASAEQITLEAAVIRAADALREAEPFSERDVLQQLFAAQKRLALELYQGLGVELTAAERERILEHRTESLEALLAFGRGLAEEDEGNYAAAAQHYRQAAQLDPGFEAAQVRADETELTAGTETAMPSAAVDVVAAGAPADAGFQDQGFLDQLEGLIPDPIARDAVAESQGTEGVGRMTLLEIIIRRP